MNGLIEGRVVHYVLSEGPFAGRCRAAMVIGIAHHENGLVNLRIWLNGKMDQVVRMNNTVEELLETNVKYSSKNEPGTWHFMEKA